MPIRESRVVVGARPVGLEIGGGAWDEGGECASTPMTPVATKSGSFAWLRCDEGL